MKPSSSTAFVDPSTFAGEMTRCLGFPSPERRTDGEIALGHVADEKGSALDRSLSEQPLAASKMVGIFASAGTP